MGNKFLDTIDFHSHILPGADHGSDSVATSLSQLALAKEQGVMRIVATPHFYPHCHLVDDFLLLRSRAAEMLFAEMGDDMPRIRLGAEVLVCPGLENLPGLERLCIEGTNVILLELPFGRLPNDCLNSIVKIKSKGFDVVLAHVDRYEESDIESLIKEGIDRLQINAVSLCGIFKNKSVYSYLDRGLVVALGSDIHGANKKAYRYFAKARERLTAYPYVAQASDAIWGNR